MEPNHTRRAVQQAYLAIDLHGDASARLIRPIADQFGQVQISDKDQEWVLHFLGTPESWRQLAKEIEDAAMELERVLSDEAVAS